eukprot:1834801-Karenia_brevis.AAC.1
MPSRDQALADEVRAVEAYLADGLVSKAISVARGALSTLVTSGAAGALALLFPAGQLPPARTDISDVSAELRSKLEAAAARGLTHYARRKGPGPNGSRFEHWGSTGTDDVSLRAASEVVVAFLLGE